MEISDQLFLDARNLLNMSIELLDHYVRVLQDAVEFKHLFLGLVIDPGILPLV